MPYTRGPPIHNNNLPMPQKIALRSASDPFILQLKEPYFLNHENLKEQTDKKVQRDKSWNYPDVKFLKTSNNVARFWVIKEKSRFEMTVRIEASQLAISCSCGSNVVTICHHVYQALFLVSQVDNLYFQDYISNGLVELALSNKNCFTIETFPYRLRISPIKEMGSVFKINIGPTDEDLKGALNFPSKPKTLQTTSDTRVLYMIVFSRNSRFIPMLYPCVGVLNKARDNIKRLLTFALQQKAANNEQIGGVPRLNELSLAIRKLSNKQNGELFAMKAKERTDLYSVYKLWHEAFSMLEHQPFVHIYMSYGLKWFNRTPPRLSHASITTPSLDSPVLSFLLTDKGTYYTLSLHIHISGKKVKSFEYFGTFFLEIAKRLYFIQSLMDVAILEWFFKTFSGHISIFKRDFPEFDNKYLKPLRAKYTIELK